LLFASAREARGERFSGFVCTAPQVAAGPVLLGMLTRHHESPRKLSFNSATGAF
jgi:hypothetical protein